MIPDLIRRFFWHGVAWGATVGFGIGLVAGVGVCRWIRELSDPIRDD